MFIDKLDINILEEVIINKYQYNNVLMLIILLLIKWFIFSSNINYYDYN